MKNLLPIGSLALCAMLLPLGAQAQVLISDDFSTAGDVNSSRTPNLETIDGRKYIKVTNNSNYSTAVNVNAPGTARMYVNVGGAISLADSGDFTKPEQLMIAATFSMGTLTNNTPARTGRGVYLGFWSEVQFSTDSMTNMYGVFVNPDTGRLVLWQGESTSNGTALATLDYAGVWDDDAFHTMSYCIDISGAETGTAGNIYNFMLDDVAYDWGTVSIFTDANTSYAGFGASAANAGEYGAFDEWSVTAIPEASSSLYILLLGGLSVFIRKCWMRRNR